MKTYIISFSLFLMGSFSLTAQNDSMHITGQFSGFEEGIYLYLWTNTGGVGSIADSAQVINNHYSITHKLPESPSVVYIAGKNFNPMMRFWAENIPIKLKGDREAFDKSSIIGSPINEVALKLKEQSDNKEERIKLIEQYIDREPAIQSLYFLKDKISQEVLSILYGKIPQKLQTYDYAKRINSHLSLLDVAIPNIGDQLVDFEAHDAQGNKYTLADLNDRFVILEFGSSYCGPCFFAVPELSKLQEEQKDNLRIVSFSLDTRENNWRKGLERIAEREKYAHVLHIWDGEGENGTIPVKYGVFGIPVFYLFNPEGKVIDKWEGYREGEIIKHWEAVQQATVDDRR